MVESMSGRGFEAAGHLLKVFFFDMCIITQFTKYPENREKQIIECLVGL